MFNDNVYQTLLVLYVYNCKHCDSTQLWGYGRNCSHTAATL